MLKHELCRQLHNIKCIPAYLPEKWAGPALQLKINQADIEKEDDSSGFIPKDRANNNMDAQDDISDAHAFNTSYADP